MGRIRAIVQPCCFSGLDDVVALLQIRYAWQTLVHSTACAAAMRLFAN